MLFREVAFQTTKIAYTNIDRENQMAKFTVIKEEKVNVHYCAEQSGAFIFGKQPLYTICTTQRQYNALKEP